MNRFAIIVAAAVGMHCAALQGAPPAVTGEAGWKVTIKGNDNPQLFEVRAVEIVANQQSPKPVTPPVFDASSRAYKFEIPADIRGTPTGNVTFQINVFFRQRSSVTDKWERDQTEIKWTFNKDGAPQVSTGVNDNRPAPVAPRLSARLDGTGPDIDPTSDVQRGELRFGLKEFIMERHRERRGLPNFDHHPQQTATDIANLFGGLAATAEKDSRDSHTPAALQGTLNGFRKQIRTGLDKLYERPGVVEDWKPILVQLSDRVATIAKDSQLPKDPNYLGTPVDLGDLMHVKVVFAEVHNGFQAIADAEKQRVEDLARARQEAAALGILPGTAAASGGSAGRYCGCPRCRRSRCCSLLLGF